jgi:transcriptional regulator with XRE-family HTH domain
MNSLSSQAQPTEEAQVLRQQAGRWLKSLREARGMSQRDLALKIGFEYYTFVSQLESGRGRVPPAQYEAFASALNYPIRDFVKTLMQYYDPWTFRALFGDDTRTEAEAPAEDGVAKLAARLARLESLIDKPVTTTP